EAEPLDSAAPAMAAVPDTEAVRVGASSPSSSGELSIPIGPNGVRPIPPRISEPDGSSGPEASEPVHTEPAMVNSPGSPEASTKSSEGRGGGSESIAISPPWPLGRGPEPRVADDGEGPDEKLESGAASLALAERFLRRGNVGLFSQVCEVGRELEYDL